jgi:hypothetical protein
MNYRKLISPSVLLVFFFVPMLSFCQKKDKKHKKKHKHEQQVAADENNKSNVDCDKSYWKYVYNPDRLKVINKCKIVTGVIEESNPDEDGDQHMLLKLDKGQKELLTSRNKEKKQGDLVIEAVCANKTTLKKVGTTCNGYINKIQIPTVGEHVQVTGSYVIDTHNGWAEIHPITKIEVIK